LTSSAPGKVTYSLFSGGKDWPATPGAAPAVLTFIVPANATAAHVGFSWRGQAPGGYSSSRVATLKDAAGKETQLTGADLPANPYLCANSKCGPAEKVLDFDPAAIGTWSLRLEGAYTATAILHVTVDATR
jgi:hypothetical protein